MSDENRDMIIPDSYYKAKRSSLISSAILVLLHFAEPSAHATAPWLDIHIPIKTAAMLVWVVSAYYAAIFGWEWYLARRLNSEFLVGASFAVVDTRVAEISKSLQTFGNQLKQEAETITRMMSTITERGSHFPPSTLKTELDMTMHSLRHALARTQGETNAQLVDEVQAKVIAACEAGIQTRIKPLLDMRDYFGGQLDHTKKAIATFGIEMRDLQSSLSGLANAIRWERRVLFYGFDLIPVEGLFGIATIVIFPLIVSSVS